MAERQATKNARAIAERGMALANENVRLRLLLVEASKSMWALDGDLTLIRHRAKEVGWAHVCDPADIDRVVGVERELQKRIESALNEGRNDG